jgi:ribonuclease VapC
LIVDTSALIAIALAEPAWQQLRDALSATICTIPAPVLTELQLAIPYRSPTFRAAADSLIAHLLYTGAEVAAFERRHAEMTVSARARYGRGNGRGGLLNFGDLMVYAIAKDYSQPLLCTGRDFAPTDLELHPASRIDP